MKLRPGHGYLVLRDLTVDALVLDGNEVPDPKSVDDPRFKGSFRGFSDVPAGTHTIVGRVKDKEHSMTVTVFPGWATVKRFDMDTGWADDEDETKQQYRRLAMSGSMAESGALRPWPLGLVFLRGKSDGVQVDGHALGDSLLPFHAIVDVPPGKHTVTRGEKTVEFDAAAESVTVIDLEDGPTIADVKLAAIATDLGALPADALRPHRTLGSESTTRTFGDADFEWLTSAFAESAEGSTANYLAALRWHYIRDSEMAKQAGYFWRLGIRLAAQIKTRPSIVRDAEVARYYGYFAEDLADAGNPLTATAAKELAEAIAGAASAPAPSVPPPRRTAPVAPPPSKVKLFIGLAIGLAVGIAIVMATR